MVGCIVFHNTFGNGTIVGTGEPRPSGKERCSRNGCIIYCSSCPYPTETTGAKKLKKVGRPNVASMCNYCDGGKTPTCIGVNGVCSESHMLREWIPVRVLFKLELIVENQCVF